ncbi:hydroxyethylthiazole kinase [Alkalicoccus halolimnae]|uniref:Hydroxyethylthiazole kinase n=1 Tax=Alkalicoccus halolimnae TaxID=1667239 RepID=A0A5C7F395_9BACI|nr:hydroxyethylthiazole kinase [Alkalicoccus halolimnae]TXF85082.1 hydroxyethylthiazole kinase [Alkalicoccus halolimnae]
MPDPILLRKKIRETSPLIHNITNVVVTNFTANGLYALGASPVMAYALEEVKDMAKIAGALVLNIGTLSKQTNEAMLAAGHSANEQGIPVFLDPVGAGATPFRTESAKTLLKELNISVIRGNAGEIANLSSSPVAMRGVDSTAELKDAKKTAESTALEWQTIVCMTGEQDIITDGRSTFIVSNGTEMLTKITGAGCLLTSVAAAFSSVEKNALEAVTAACAFYGASAEAAAERQSFSGPGHFQVHLLDMIDQISDEDLQNRIQIHKEEE